MSSIASSAEEASRTHVPEESLQALVFDCDGTLVDSMPVYWKSWMKICEEYNLKLTWQRFLDLAGTPVKDIIKILLDEKAQGEGDHGVSLEEVYEKKKVYGAKVVDDFGTPAIEVVIDIVRKYHGKLPLAVASSGNKTHVMKSLEGCDLVKYFDVIVTIEDVSNPKPAPDLFLEACKRLNCDPAFCRGFEDADLGMESLRCAGMEAVDVRLMAGYPHFTPT